MAEGGEAVADPGGPPLTEPLAAENRRLSACTRQIWRKRGRLGLKCGGHRHAGILSETNDLLSLEYLQISANVSCDVCLSFRPPCVQKAAGSHERSEERAESSDESSLQEKISALRGGGVKVTPAIPSQS